MTEYRQPRSKSALRKGRPMLFVERRHTARFELQLPVIVRWKNGSKLREARTRCEDVSPKGVYFALAEDIKDGTIVEVELSLPSVLTSEEQVRICCSGYVQRTELDGAKAYVAAVIETSRMLEDSRSVARLSGSDGI